MNMVSTNRGSQISGSRTAVYSPSSESSSTKGSNESASTKDVVKNDNNIIEVAAHGDLVLRIKHETKASKVVHLFRVDSPALKANSQYFERLLRPGRFNEAESMQRKHAQLVELHGVLPAAPWEELPTIDIVDVGRISAVRSLDALLADFLYILHGKDTQSFPPVTNLANLAIVADRFDALEIVKSYVQRKKIMKALEGKTTPKIESGLTEEKVRQRLFVGLLLDYPLWVERYSTRLIMKGWVGRDVNIDSPSWWDLPFRVEEELACRRECVLETIQSVQANFISLYTSRDKHCRMGYDNSTQCDSFQLGEMLRFFSRIGTIAIQGTILDTSDAPAPYSGDVAALLETFRQVPEYQIDKNHSHCGIRNRMLPILSLIEECLQYVGICFDCWQEHRGDYAWIEAKRPLLWKRQEFRLKAQGHSNRHEGIRALFSATERQWNS